MWFTCFAVFTVQKNCFHALNNVNQTFMNVFCFLFFDLYKEYNSCLVSFLSFSELFPAFKWAKEIGNLLSIWLGVRTFNPCPDWFFLCTTDSSLSKSSVSVASDCSSDFCFLNFVPSVILSSNFGSFSLSNSKGSFCVSYLDCVSSALFFNFKISYLSSTILKS